jgi:hypothetical protein
MIGVAGRRNRKLIKKGRVEVIASASDRLRRFTGCELPRKSSDC